MIENYRKIVVSKTAFRRKLAARSIGEKLRMLDSLRERQLAIHKARVSLPTRSKTSGNAR